MRKLLLIVTVHLLMLSNALAYTIINDSTTFYSMYENPANVWEADPYYGPATAVSHYSILGSWSIKSHFTHPYPYTGPSWGMFWDLVMVGNNGIYAPNTGYSLVISTPRNWDQPFAVYKGSAFYGVIPDDASESGFMLSNRITRFEAGFSEVSPAPEPSTMLLLASGLVGLAGFRKKFRKS